VVLTNTFNKPILVKDRQGEIIIIITVMTDKIMLELKVNGYKLTYNIQTLIKKYHMTYKTLS